VRWSASVLRYAVGGWKEGELAEPLTPEQEQLIEQLAQETITAYFDGSMPLKEPAALIPLGMPPSVGPSLAGPVWDDLTRKKVIPESLQARFEYVIGRHHKINLRDTQTADYFFRRAAGGVQPGSPLASLLEKERR
jgi:hypothetical protein